MGMFALDTAMADVEIIYVTESAAQYRLAERVLGDLRLAYGLPSRLIVPDRALPEGALLSGALRSARGPFVTLFGPDVVPESPGWLVKLVSFLKGNPQRGIVGGQILYEDHSLVSAGLYIGADDEGRWALMPRLSGFPRDYAAAAVPTRAAAVSADCLTISRALLQEMGGPADDYLLSHSACADLCLRARALRREVGRLPEPAFFRIGEHISAMGEAYHTACAEMDRRNLERRWRERLGTSLETSGRSKPLLHQVGTREGSMPAKRAA
jgi:O-antigen biosynthesis protein